jgi:hypothetical protein
VPDDYSFLSQLQDGKSMVGIALAKLYLRDHEAEVVQYEDAPGVLDHLG